MLRACLEEKANIEIHDVLERRRMKGESTGEEQSESGKKKEKGSEEPEDRS